MTDFGEELKRLREEAGLTQGGLARLIGIETSAISRWEHGAVKPSFPSVRKLTDALASGDLLWDAAGLRSPAAANLLETALVVQSTITVALNGLKAHIGLDRRVLITVDTVNGLSPEFDGAEFIVWSDAVKRALKS